MDCVEAVENVLTCVDFTAEAAGVGLQLPYTMQPFIRGEQIVAEKEQPAFLIWSETLGPSEEPCIDPSDIIEAFFQICMDEVRNSGEWIAKMGG